MPDTPIGVTFVGQDLYKSVVIVDSVYTIQMLFYILYLVPATLTVNYINERAMSPMRSSYSFDTDNIFNDWTSNSQHLRYLIKEILHVGHVVMFCPNR